MSIDADYVAMIERLEKTQPPAIVTGVYLPDLVEDGVYRDEFGFVQLSDGSVGPFYVSLKPVLATLRDRFPAGNRIRLDAVAVALGLAGGDLAERALAIGAFNALSHRLMRCAGYDPPDRGPAKEADPTDADAPTGVVGYFSPVIDRLVDSGSQVLVLERQPARVPERPNVRLTTLPEELAVCRRVLCTASVLINDTLDPLLAACSHGVRFQLIGPTGSGLPDALFARGLESVGGIRFDDPVRLGQVLARREPWGSGGRKYEICASDYPGIERLIADCGRRKP